jgi:hypothetical protein
MCVCKEVGKKIEPLPSFSSRGQRHFKGVWQSYRQQEVVILNCLISQGFIDLICGAVAFLLHARYSRISFIQLHTRFSTVAFVLEWWIRLYEMIANYSNSSDVRTSFAIMQKGIFLELFTRNNIINNFKRIKIISLNHCYSFVPLHDGIYIWDGTYLGGVMVSVFAIRSKVRGFKTRPRAMDF